MSSTFLSKKTLTCKDSIVKFIFHKPITHFAMKHMCVCSVQTTQKFLDRCLTNSAAEVNKKSSGSWQLKLDNKRRLSRQEKKFSVDPWIIAGEVFYPGDFSNSKDVKTKKCPIITRRGFKICTNFKRVLYTSMKRLNL